MGLKFADELAYLQIRTDSTQRSSCGILDLTRLHPRGELPRTACLAFVGFRGLGTLHTIQFLFSILSSTPSIPLLLAGPVLRRVTARQVVVNLVLSRPAAVHACVFVAGAEPVHAECFELAHSGEFRLGTHAYLHALCMDLEQDLPRDQWIAYDLGVQDGDAVRWLNELAPGLSYTGHDRPGFVLKARTDHVLHGSCRKPHHDGEDALASVDGLLQAARDTGVEQQPAMLLFTGDQVYTDDIAGPHLAAIDQLSQLLGLFEESLPGSNSVSSNSLQSNPHYYRRSSLLPTSTKAQGIDEVLFSGARKPVFTSINAENHLMTLGEVLAQYLLCWSPVPWTLVDIDAVPMSVPDAHRQVYVKQLRSLRRFVSGLDRVRRVMANVPCYMIFDDHDITDDWNLSRAWEKRAYESPLARRIIGNALIGYWLFQGWGNAPENFDEALMGSGRRLLLGEGEPDAHDALIGQLLKYERWGYVVETLPRVVVMDTRTQRWHSEHAGSWPSGLMDWESLAATQQQLLGQPSVILVSAAPIFGVKLIEIVQRVATWCGLSLVIDAENWMAHRGSASAILNVFRHRKTPRHFVILSGDVHYAFAFDILLRRVVDGPEIWQITSSGLGNSFPPALLRRFDRLNRFLFASRSPLNWLTQRRRMRIKQRRPSQYSGRYPHQRLVNGAGVGRVYLNESGQPTRIEHVLATGEVVEFSPGYETDWVH